MSCDAEIYAAKKLLTAGIRNDLMAPPRALMSTLSETSASAPVEPAPTGQLALAIHVQVEPKPQPPKRARVKSSSAAASSVPEAIEAKLPEIQPLAAPGLPVRLELGTRCLIAIVGPEGAHLHDESGARVKSLRKTKRDDPRAFALAKARWLELRARGTTDFDLDAAWLFVLERALLTGQSASVGELQAAWATPAGPRNLAGTLWVALESGAPLRWDEGQLIDAGAPLPDSARVRLAHPAREQELQLQGLQAARARHRPDDPEAFELSPRSARIRRSTLGRILTGLGFEAAGEAEPAWHLLAPELGGIAVIRCDLTGSPQLSFRRWNGRLDGGALMRMGEVEPQLYAEAYETLLSALPCE